MDGTCRCELDFVDDDKVQCRIFINTIINIVCCVLFERDVLICVICVCFVLCLIVVPLSPDKNPFAIHLNNNKNIKYGICSLPVQMLVFQHDS
jgi:hypothetical protein